MQFMSDPMAVRLVAACLFLIAIGLGFFYRKNSRREK
jgi:hypothetical protein